MSKSHSHSHSASWGWSGGEHCGPPWAESGARHGGPKHVSWSWGGGMPMPPFGPGNPFEFFFGSPRRRRRGGPRGRRGDIRTGILLLLAEEPRSGYEIIREGRERSGGAWRPSPGSVYPMLQQLQDEGLVRPSGTAGEGRRRPFELTEDGRGYVESHAEELRPPWEAVEEEGEESFPGLRGLTFQVITATMQVAQAGTPDQVERAERILADTRRALYRVLAEEDEAPADESGTD